ncbi:hypothetical protein EXIGLDRAFT_142058 [Exidia glandulosa HHB12029]|uniref:Uncharacterized protein n=1 Tax=Exidia glandulosa HHB12029 TaxID=1314781 RepID=A0A165FUF0_EXIGL|nr:hypothetical protein EXIGLDRAFT_142058 [Exidia glandulosa HHB12029]
MRRDVGVRACSERAPVCKATLLSPSSYGCSCHCRFKLLPSSRNRNGDMAVHRSSRRHKHLESGGAGLDMLSRMTVAWAGGVHLRQDILQSQECLCQNIRVPWLTLPRPASCCATCPARLLDALFVSTATEARRWCVDRGLRWLAYGRSPFFGE